MSWWSLLVFGALLRSVVYLLNFILKLPLLQERTKAMGYVESNLLKANHTSVVPLDDVTRLRAPDNINQLLVHVIGCSNIESRRKGSVSVDPILKSTRIILFL